MYAIGGSANPTIFSEGNYFMASNDSAAKQVTKRETTEKWNNWKWSSFQDEFLNGAYFVPSGSNERTKANIPLENLHEGVNSIDFGISLSDDENEFNETKVNEDTKEKSLDDGQGLLHKLNNARVTLTTLPIMLL
ncbi:pectate lyase 16 [Spatholobus suberectus]|nr:pectate lyase 16 [Spatholobus suberectus]